MPKCYQGLSVNTVWLREQFWGYLSIETGEIYFYLQNGIYFWKLGKKEDILQYGIGPNIGLWWYGEKALLMVGLR